MEQTFVPPGSRALLSLPTPRPIPPTLQIAQFLAPATQAVLFVAGWWAFIAVPRFLQTDWTSWRRFGAETLLAHGEVTDVQLVSGDEPVEGRPGRETSVYRVEYRFATADNAARLGSCFRDGPRPRIGQIENVEYLGREPEVSRIVGTRRALHGIAILPLGVTLVIALSAVRLWHAGWRAVYLLRFGRALLARLAQVEAVHRSRAAAAYRLMYEYVGPDGRVRRHVEITTEVLRTRQPTAVLLADPRGGAASTLVGLPHPVVPDERGRFPAPGLWATLLRLVLPGMVAVELAAIAALYAW